MPKHIMEYTNGNKFTHGYTYGMLRVGGTYVQILS